MSCGAHDLPETDHDRLPVAGVSPSDSSKYIVDEYKMVAALFIELFRTRFVVLGAYLAYIALSCGSVVAGGFGSPKSLLLAVVTILITGIVWMMEMRNRSLIDNSALRLKSIEENWGYSPDGSSYFTYFVQQNRRITQTGYLDQQGKNSDTGSGFLE
jgi:hypothetical protein